MQYKSKGIGATKQYIKNAHDLYLIPKNVAVKNIANQGHIIVKCITKNVVMKNM